MPYFYQQVKSELGFDYGNLENIDFLSNLSYVRRTSNGRLIYQVRFPNAPVEYEDSLILSLNKEGGLTTYKRRDHQDGFIEVEVSDIDWLIKNYFYMGSYCKFVASCFLCCSTYHIG